MTANIKDLIILVEECERFYSEARERRNIAQLAVYEAAKSAGLARDALALEVKKVGAVSVSLSDGEVTTVEISGRELRIVKSRTLPKIRELDSARGGSDR